MSTPTPAANPAAPLTVPLNQLLPHPAQMRVHYDLDGLAALTLQLHQRGLDAWQPILVSQKETGCHIISGHRRQMGLLLSLALQDWADKRGDNPEITVEVVRMALSSFIEQIGSLEQVVASLRQKYGDREIPVMLFNGGGRKEEILALQAANYGGEQPDMLGIARSFQQAVEAGATEAEIARNSGQHPHYVRNHLALTQIPTELAQRIASGELPMSLAAIVADLPEPKRTGLAIYLLANPSAGSGTASPVNGDGSGKNGGKATVKTIKECAAILKKWPGLQLPLLPKHQAQRNTARALVNLWGQVVKAYPEDAYAAAAMLICRNAHDEPWSAQEKLSLWFRALGGETYFADGKIHWANVVAYLIPEVNCQSCPIAQLPADKLRNDLGQGQSGPLGMPCRAGEQAARCLHGLAENDPFDVRVPWSWSKRPGVVYEGGDYRVGQLEDLQTAWKAQKRVEAEEDGQAAASSGAAAAGSGAAANGAASNGAASAALPVVTAGKKGKGQQTAVAPPPPDPDAPPAADSPIAKQRAQIVAFMQGHEQLAVNHPFATPCGDCRHRLTASPTKDETVPHCAWAGRLRSVEFHQLATDDAKAPRIPVCRQYAPNRPWHEIIPAYPQPPQIARDWLKTQISFLIIDANRHGGSVRNTFEFLTGRPMSANEGYGDWFFNQLNEQIGNLSEGQLFTLFVWTHAEWRRAQRQPFSLPVNGVQFAFYHEERWS